MHPEGKRKFIRTGPLANDLDIKTYDVANLYVNTVDSAAAGAWGKLWVEYDVILSTPQAQSGIPVGVPGGRLIGLTAMTQGLPFGTGGVVDGQSSGFTYDGTTGVITFQKAGSYLCAWNLAGTTMSTPAFALTNVTLLVQGSTFNTGSTAGTALVVFDVTAANGTVVCSLTAATVTTSVLYIGVGPQLSFS